MNESKNPNKLTWWHWTTLILLIALLIISCIALHYLWKLSDIWQAVKGSK